MSTLYLIHDPELDAATLAEATDLIRRYQGRAPRVLPLHRHPPKAAAGSLLYLLIPDETFAEWFAAIAPREVTVIPLPYARNPRQQHLFSIPRRLQEAVEGSVELSGRMLASYLTANGRPVLGPVQIGACRWMEESLSLSAVGRLFGLHLTPLKLETAGGQEIRTAGLTIEAGHEALLPRSRGAFFKSGDNLCRRVATVVYAPQSILQALRLRLFLLRHGTAEAETLPPGVGTLKSDALTIRHDEGRPLPVRYDGREQQVTALTLTSHTARARLFVPDLACAGGEAKESLRIQNLPTDGDSITFFTRRSLPLVPIASEEAFAELFTRLREAAGMPLYYVVLLLISVLMATTGLFQNSSPTIIGAMILAPLMAPIIAFSMGAIRFDGTLMRRSVRTILFSVLIALTASAALAWLLPFSHLTDQMAARTHPTLLDLAVAIFSGVAAAYGYANSKVGESLAGVAIAVALIPPLCVSGIGIGWGAWSIFSNAFLLFLANIVGIVVASGAMFYLLGYASRKYASAAFFIKLLMVAVIAVPLWLSTRTLVKEERIYEAMATLKEIRLKETTVSLYLRGIVPKSDGLYAVIYVTSPHPLDARAKKRIAQTIRRRLGEGVHLILTFQELYK